ncbi:PAS and ANTAR domain-containing protein [Modestobacter sp. SSW1-42]|uniref:PAS and ANTAR domain-containing protein n=1 Tax=Modestobacter sp. SSW1-42 TaxID=596372 RepID=UPI003985C852
MSSTSALPRHADAGPRLADATPGRAHRSLPPQANAARVAGRFRGDLATEQWWWSPELHDLLGVPAGTVRPTVQLLLSHVHDDDRSALREALLVAGTTGTAFAREYRVQRGDGAARSLLLVCEPELDASGTVLALAGLAVDVTEGRPPAAEDTTVRSLQTEVEQLRSAMASRAAIEQAKGILMVLMSCGDQVAFDLLAHISSHTHRKVREVAVLIIDSASGRAPLPDDVREILHDASPPAHSA